MDKEKKMIYLFQKRWDRGHKWQLIGRDFMKYKVEYECEHCKMFHQLDVFNLADTKGHEQLLNHLIPRCV